MFSGKVALITGGCSGIGKATAVKFAAAGANLIILDKNPLAGNELVKTIQSEYGRKILYLDCDVSNDIEVRDSIASGVNKLGRLDFAYNNAGIGGDSGNIQNYPVDDWDKVMAINLKGVFLSMKYEIPYILQQGKGAIVNCASLLSTVAYEDDSAYVASKFGVLGLTKTAAVEYARLGIRINAISPGFTRTPMIDKGDEEKLRKISDKHPIGRLASPEEIADGVLWLCSEHSTFCIGTNLMMDGGYTVI